MNNHDFAVTTTSLPTSFDHRRHLLHHHLPFTSNINVISQPLRHYYRYSPPIGVKYIGFVGMVSQILLEKGSVILDLCQCAK